MTEPTGPDAVEFSDPDAIELTVGPVAHGGHCVARTGSGQVVFVRHALPGERVLARITEEQRGFLRADAVEVLAGSASVDRVSPPCPWSGPARCGGCDFQHVSLAAQRELKAAVISELLQRIGGLSPAEVAQLGVRVAAVPPPPSGRAEVADGAERADGADGLGWRTRVRYTVDATGRAGLLAHRSHEVVPVDWCRIAHPLVTSAPVLDRAWPNADTVDVVASAGGDRTVTSRAADARSTIVEGPEWVREQAVGREWSIPAGVFWQVHPGAADALAGTVVQLLAPKPGQRAWDLYGGAGLFAAALAPHLDATGRITVVESDPMAAATAKRCLLELTTVTVVTADVRRALANPRWRSVDLVVLDPPRSGAGASVVRAIVARSPQAVAYVACDPAALARDIRTFRRLGWRLAQLRAFDLFPMTHHMECVALVSP